MSTTAVTTLSLDSSPHAEKPTPVGHFPLPKHTPRAWEEVDNDISRRLPSRSRDYDFWWNTTGVALAILLDKASYSFSEQRRYLSLYYSAIIPELGVGACRDGYVQHWKSFMTDHHCPVEFSWEWNRKDELPIVRFSFEPIGIAAGTKDDPFNKSSTMRFVHERAPWIPDCDLTWFQHLWDGLVTFEPTLTKSRTELEQDSISMSHESRSFLALDLNDTSLVLKAYFMPGFKARDDGKSTLTVIRNSIEALPCLTDAFHASYNTWVDFLTSTISGRQLTPEIVATDCVAPKDSRIKIYMRSPSTSLRSVIDTLCLEQEDMRSKSASSIQEFRRLWAAAFGLTEPKDDEELQFSEHRTAGILYYFELSPKRALPAVKVYLPIRHYGGEDHESARRLQDFIRTTSRKDYTDSYVEALENIISTSAYPQQRGFQTYLCAMLSGDSLRLTSYLSPIVYRVVEGKVRRKMSWPQGKRFSYGCSNVQ